MADQNFRVKHGIGIGTNTFVDANRNINAGIATLRHAKVTGITTVGIISAVDGNGAQGIVTFQSRIGISSNANQITISPPSVGAGFTGSYEIILPPKAGTDGQTLTIGPNGQLGFTTAGLYENRLYVSAANGDDNNDGRALPVKTIKKAAQLASFRSFNLPEGRFIDAGNLLESNRVFIQKEVVGFVTNSYPGITTNIDFDSNICERDIGYVVDAIVYDLSYGGNSKSIEAGLAYWNAGTSYVEGESQETIAGYRYIIDLSRYIINNVAISTSYQSPPFAVAQQYDFTIAYDATCNPSAYNENCCANVLSAIGSYVGIVTSIIGIGTTAAPNVTNPSTKSEPIAIIVEAGDYVEDNPIILFEDVAVLGDNLRNTSIRPSNAGKDLFRVRNGCYVTNFAMKDYVDQAGIPQYTFDNAVAFDDPFDITTSRAGYATKLTKSVMTRSPYIQNCSILSFLGANGILVDGSKVATPNIPFIVEEVENPVINDQPEQGRSMVAAAFTMVSFGGIGWRCINEGYAQVVSCFQIFCKYGSLCQSGGYLSITNSATNFGLYALRSVGWSPNSFKFDRGRIAASGISGGLQSLKVIGVGRTDQDLYVLRFYNNANQDQTSNFKPITTQQQFNATTGISTSTDRFLITNHPFNNQDTVLYIGDEGAIPPQVIGGLVSGNQYYVSYIDQNIIELYEDNSLTRRVNLISPAVGIHTLQKGNLEFFVNEMLNTHGVYQSVGLATTAVNFVSGRSILQTVPGGSAVGFALTFRPATRELIVSVEESGGVRRLFGVTNGSTYLTIADHSGSPVSVAVTGVTGITTYRTLEFKVDSTPSGTTITNIATLPENYQLFFHRPSIVNSSGHTWEYSGSGTDYNALPQNGGQTRIESEQVFELGGRVFSSGTNELGDFKIGSFITAFNRTGNIIFNNKVTIGVLASLRLSLSGGVEIEAFSTDVGLGENEIGGPQDSKVSTQKAVRTFLNNRLGNFIDKNLTTNAVPSAVVQLNATGQINADLIPPKVVNYYRANVSGGRTDLVNLIPATNLQNGDTVIEPTNGYVLVSDVYGQYLILSSDSRNYNFNNNDTVISTNSAGGAVGIVTTPPENAVGYGTTGLVKGVLLGVTVSNGGSGYTNPGVYTCVLDTNTGIGTSARAAITVGAAGTVTQVRVNFGGRYYASGDTLTINNDNLIGGRSGGARFTVSVNDIETRLYLKLTNNQKFTGSALLSDYISDNDAVAISTDTSVGYGKTFDPGDISTGGSVDFTNDRIIVGVSTFTDGDPVIYSANGGNLIGGLTQGNTYYTKRVGITSVELYNSYALSTKIDLTSNGTGSHSLTRVGVNTSNKTIIFVNHGYTTGDAVKASGTTPTGIITGGFYFVGSITQNALTLHEIRADALTSVNGLSLNAVSIANTNGGIFSLTKQNVTYSATVNTSSTIFDNWTVLSSGTIDAANIVSGTVSPARLGAGNASDSTFLAGDSSYKKVITSVGIGTTQPISATGTTFDSAPGGIGINTYYGKVELRLNRATGTPDLYSTLGVAKFKTSTFTVDADGAVSIKPSSTGDIDAATLGGVSGAYFLDPANFTGNIPISRGGTGLSALPSFGAILQGNGISYDLITAPTFYGNVTITNNSRLEVLGIAATNISVTGATGIATFQNFRVTNEVVSGVSTFSGSGNNINQTAGTAVLNRLTVSGITTVSTLFFESLGGTSGATIPYITNTNTVHSGIVTFTSTGNNIQQQAGTAELNNLTVAGVSTFVSITNFGIANFGTVNITGTLTYANSQTAGVSTFSGSNNNINQTAGTAALNRLTVAGITTVSRLEQASNETAALQRLTVAGISTFSGQLNAGTVSASNFTGSLNNTLTIQSPLTGNSYNNSAAVTLGIDATSANTANYVVQRGSAGEFSMGALTATSATFSNLITAQSNLSAWNTTTPGTGVGGIHLGAASGTSNVGPALTFGARDASSGTNAQAGIYINSDGTYGTRMYFATTDSYAAGSKVAISIDQAGAVSITRSTLTVSSTITGTRLISSIATGTAPLTVSSTTKVTNLNADLLDDYSASVSKVANTVVVRDGSGVVNSSLFADVDQGIVNQNNGNSAAWYGRILSKNSTSDRASFLGIYGSIAGVFAHNNALSAWADLYVNTVDGASGGTVRMPSSVLVNGSQVWHAGNDGPGSGLDADTLDTLQLHTGTNNEANKVVRTDANGYIQAGWINSISGELGDWGNGATRYTASNDQYLRYLTRNSIKVQLGLTAKYDADRRDFTTDSNYFTGIMGWGTTDLNNVMEWGSGFFDTWSNPANQPSGTSHWVGVQAYHYVNAANSGYGWQMCGGPISNLRFRSSWPTNGGWTTIAMHDRNDGSGGALYAGVYYDSNDTGFYVDPNSTTNLYRITSTNAITLNGPAQFVLAGSGATRDNTTGARLSESYGALWNMGDSATWHHQVINGSMLCGFQASGTNWGSGRVVANSDIRASLFYDYNDTGYYIDPNSTSDQALRIRGGALHGPNVTWGAYLLVGGDGRQNRINDAGVASVCTTNGNLHMDAASGYQMYLNYYDGSAIYFGGGSNNNWGEWSGGILYSYGQMRATIFYDYSDTGYYCDPNGTSRLNAVTPNVINSPYSGGDSGLTRSSYAYSFGFQEQGGWSFPYPDLVLQYHTGVTMAANPGYEGISFKNDYNDGTLRFRINGGSSYTYKYTWMYTTSDGFYSDTNNAHWNPNASSSYGAWRMIGSRNGWTGIYFETGGDQLTHLMFESNNGGFYSQNSGRWWAYYSYGNNSWGFGSSTTSSSYIIYASGNIYATGTVTAASDARKKKEISTITNALDKVNQLRGVTYKRIDLKEDDSRYDRTEMGVIAQEVEPIAPELVTYAEDVDEYAVSYGNFAGLFIEAIKEQTVVINNLKKEIEILKSRLGE